jgi:uncharacterized protein YrzB (UPF0473 family)
MNDKKYVLLVFNNPEEDEQIQVPKEVKILKKVATGEVRGASCGPINISFFLSDAEMEDITSLLNKDKINFILVPEENSTHALPNYITRMFGKDFPKKFTVLYDSRDEKKKTESKKLTLEDQLAEAVKNEEFSIAAILRDKIATRDTNSMLNPKKETKDSLKEIFKRI